MNDKLRDNAINILQIAFLVVLLIANIIGTLYSVQVFNTIINPTRIQGNVISSKQITPLNTSLYQQVQKDRSNRSLFDNNSKVPQYLVNEVFGQ